MTSLASIGHWDDVADIVIVGLGLAGASTAIAAIDADPDLDILIVEKLAEEHAGGNSRVSGQTMFLPKDAKKTALYQRQLNASNPVSDEWLNAWAEGMTQLEPWVRAMAAEAGMEVVITRPDDPNLQFNIIEFPEMEGSDAVEFIATLRDDPSVVFTPSGLWETFRRCLYARNVRRRFEQRVVDLIQDPDTDEIYGVRLLCEAGTPMNVMARRGVVLAMGGYENDDSMLRNYVGLSDTVPFGSPGNTGDGIRILQRAGAEMRNFTQNSTLAGGVWPAFRIPGQETGFMRQLLWDAWSWIDVADDSTRFIDEGVDYRWMHYKVKKHGIWQDTEYPWVGTTHMIFDDRTRDSQKLIFDMMTWSALVGEYRWSEDNSAEVENNIITSADTIEELAVKIGRDPAKLSKTVHEFNADARSGKDTRFGRDADKMWPIEGGPYHAIRIFPGVICTGGGPARDGRSRVLKQSASPIPRLYAAGELGSIHTDLYQLGAYLTECMVSGRAAAGDLLNATTWQTHQSNKV